MTTRSLTFSLLAVLLPLPAEAAGIQLQPHRAVYELVMTHSGQGSGVANASGAIFYEFAEACDGWKISNRTIIRTLYEEGPEQTSDWTYTSWESRDGSSYRFSVASEVNGRPVDDIAGTAGTTTDGGEARFTSPKARSLELTAGTLFPTRHIEALVSAARSGEQFLLADVFDGFASDSPYYSVNAFIGPRREPDTDAKPGTDVDSWKMRLAFFDKQSREEKPDYELGIRYFENGVATEVLQDFGNMTIDGRLREIELLPRPEC
jgi:hypothetical protein